jgi:RimJ/RimL family protein N-acetyltransferase
MDPHWWPLAGLRLETPRLELRVPSDADLAALAALAERGVHDPQIQPFASPWTDVDPARRGRGTIQHHWRQRSEWTPDKWELGLAVVRDGVVVGVQDVAASDFSVLREVSTGSWLGLDHQGKGTGTEMRAAVLHLSFTGLGADFATSTAFADNPSSLAVSRKLGYVDDGIERNVRRGEPAITQRLRLDKATWAATQRVPVVIHGLGPCLPMFGLAACPESADV